MTVKNVSNLAASVQARLQNHARASKRPFQELLQYYAMERFLYRLTRSPHAGRLYPFILGRDAPDGNRGVRVRIAAYAGFPVCGRRLSGECRCSSN